MTGWIRHKFTVLAVYLLIVAAVTAGVWRYGYVQALDQLARRGEADLALAADRLVGQLQRYQEQAVLLVDHPVLANSTLGADATAAHNLLQEVADKTAALDLSYANAQGQVLAAALQHEPRENLSDEPHFQRAMHGALGASHGVSARYGQRVFHFAAPRFGTDGRVQGVLSVAVDIENLEWDWPGGRPAVVFIDQGGTVFISNRSELLFWTRESAHGGLISPTGAARKMAVIQRANHDIWQVNWGPYLPENALHIVKPLPVIGMQAEAFVDTAPAQRLAGLQAAVVAAVFLAFGVFLWQAMQRRLVLTEANIVLEDRVAARTRALTDANTQLRREVAERQEAEAALRQAQADLVQAGKLSALGQMSAGISHELNQPLMAIQQFADNGTEFMARGKPEVAVENLGRISAMAARMARIIRNLRAFVRNESEPMGRVDIVAVVDAAVELAETRLRKDEVTLLWKRPDRPIWVLGGEVRLGQVVVNLINNAADAMAESTDRQITLSIQTGLRMTLSVADTGPGIQEPEKIFDPFFSTKAVGSSEGMGLGLSISYGLVQSFGGDIRGMNSDEGGAMFTVELDFWAEERVA